MWSEKEYGNLRIYYDSGGSVIEYGNLKLYYDSGGFVIKRAVRDVEYFGGGKASRSNPWKFTYLICA